MNTFRKPSLAKRCLESLLLLAAAALLLRASWLPVIEIKGFDTFALESVAMWATRAARVTLIAVILCLLVRPLALARWWMALSVGQGDMSELIVIKTGTWVCAAGLACWLLDIAAATIGIVRGWRGK
jgi:hypothetical protein